MFGGGFCWDIISERGVEIEPNVKLKCVPKFCNLGDTFGAGGGVDETARCGLECDVHGLSSRSYHPFSYHTKGNIFRACVQCVDIGLRHGQRRLRICIAWREQSMKVSKKHKIHTCARM